MARKLNVPSVVGLNIENVSPGLLMFLQACQDSFNTVDASAIYKDTVTINVPTPNLKATSVQGQAFSVEGVTLASGDEYATFVRDFKTHLQDFLALRQTVADLTEQLRGTQ